MSKAVVGLVAVAVLAFVAFGGLPAAALIAVVAVPALGALASANIRATDEKRPAHKQLSALADTQKIPPGGIANGKARAQRKSAGDFGRGMAAACGCKTAEVLTRRDNWTGKKQ